MYPVSLLLRRVFFWIGLVFFWSTSVPPYKVVVYSLEKRDNNYLSDNDAIETNTHDNTLSTTTATASVPTHTDSSYPTDDSSTSVGSKDSIGSAFSEPTSTIRTRPLLVADDVDPQMDYYRFDRSSTDTVRSTELDAVWNNNNNEGIDSSLLFSSKRRTTATNTKEKEEEEDHTDSVEWITADELKRRITIENEKRKYTDPLSSSSSFPTGTMDNKDQIMNAKKRLLEQIKEKFYNPPQPTIITSSSSSVSGIPDTVDAASKDRRLQDVEATATPTNGPIYPINPEDIPVEVDVFGVPVMFREPETNRTKDTRPDVPLVPEATCRTDEIVRCPSLLSSCLGIDAENREAACECFRQNGKCYKESGCFEMIPKTTINFCFYRFFCEMDQCEGAGALSLHQFAFSFIVWSLVTMAIGWLL